MRAEQPCAEHAAAFVYGGSITRAIARYKYEGRVDLAGPLGDILAGSADAFRDRVDLVTSVPLHKRRLVDRGFDQAALLAKPVAAALGLAWAPVLERTRETTQQASLDRAARAENVAAAFQVPRQGRVTGRRVLVVDDVRTTGATLAACMEALRAGGARSVYTLVLARRDDEADGT